MVIIEDGLFQEESRRPELVSLSLDFLEEADWGVTPDPSAMWRYLGAVAENASYLTHSAVDTDTGMIVGYSIGSYSYIFAKEPVGVTEFLYVKPEYRNYKTAYKLLKATHDGLVDAGCAQIFSNSVSDISARISRGFSGIIQRIGYVKEGETYGWRSPR
jgi:hypothetical protein